MKKINTFTKAFTLIEMLVVIAIIAILTGTIVSTLLSSRSKARDAQRISDIGQIQLALELYYDRCKQYPSASLNTNSSTGCPTGITLGSFISRIPTPPANSPSDYVYVTENNPPSNYILSVQLENNNAVQQNSYQGTVFGSVTCFDGSNKFYCLGPK